MSLAMVLIICFSASAYKYSYSFHNIPLAEAIVRLSKDHPDIEISFIYKELDKYRTSARIHTDDVYDALRGIIALNPVTVVRKKGNFYIEALQHGKYSYTGRVVGTDNLPVSAATVMLLSPKDSTVLTYGISGAEGYFSIPCDRERVIAKITSLGYKPYYRLCSAFSLGTIQMEVLPIRLKSVAVEADEAALYSDKSIYRPNQRQKNASQTATDLLVRMAIPQLNARLGSSVVTTASGESVAFFIDFVPATVQDMNMMRITDVKSVEYLVNPQDPRFLGNRNVINFRMTQYEYGGYVKALGTENFIVNSGFLQANARLVKKRITFDIMGYGYYMANDHLGIDQIEEFKLPQENGDARSFQRESMTESSEYRRKNYESSFRALYSGDKITAKSQLSFAMDNTPRNDNTGKVEYSGNMGAQSKYKNVADSKSNYLNYNGYYYFTLPANGSLSASLDYSYSHTNQNSEYTETSTATILNGAKDNTHKGSIRVNYGKTFAEKHSFMSFVRYLYENNRTRYSGSVSSLDKSTTEFGQIGSSYSFSDTKVSVSLGFGWCWLRTKLNDNKAIANYPYIDASLNFVPNKRNSFGGVFHYSVWPPSANYKSENRIQVSPFLWHTGNPVLKSHRSYDIWLNYTFIPSNKFNMTVFGGVWLVGNRAAFVYEATPEGIIRTIKQPIGSFRHFNYGMNATYKCLDGKLNLRGELSHLYVQNGKPYNIDRSYISYYLQALYYLGNFNFALSYQSANATDNYDAMSGVWTRNNDVFIFQAGWSNTSLNLRLTLSNPQRWNWRSSEDRMVSESYSIRKWISNASSHAFVQLSATYTFGFGKKVRQGNDISRQSGAASGILK